MVHALLHCWTVDSGVWVHTHDKKISRRTANVCSAIYCKKYVCKKTWVCLPLHTHAPHWSSFYCFFFCLVFSFHFRTSGTDWSMGVFYPCLGKSYLMRYKLLVISVTCQRLRTLLKFSHIFLFLELQILTKLISSHFTVTPLYKSTERNPNPWTSSG